MLALAKTNDAKVSHCLHNYFLNRSIHMVCPKSHTSVQNTKHFEYISVLSTFTLRSTLKYYWCTPKTVKQLSVEGRTQHTLNKRHIGEVADTVPLASQHSS